MNKRDTTESTSTTTALIVVGALLLMGLPLATVGAALFFYRAQAVVAPVQPPIVQSIPAQAPPTSQPMPAPPAPAENPAPVPEDQ